MMEILKKLRVDRPIVFFDIESTGANADTDQIIQISMHRLDTKGWSKFETYVMPSIAINEAAIAIHGITMDKLTELAAPRFNEIMDNLGEFMADADLCGYNILQFDVPLLENEFVRHGRQVDLSSRKLIDIFQMTGKAFSRSLDNMFYILTGTARTVSHDAGADVIDTIEVLDCLIRQFEIGNSNDALIEYASAGRQMVDYAGKFYRQDNIYYFNFSKDSRNQPVDTNPDLLEWMLDKDFPRNTLIWAKRLLDMQYGAAEMTDEEKHYKDKEKTGLDNLV